MTKKARAPWSLISIILLSLLALQTDATPGSLNHLSPSPKAPLTVVELFTSQSCSSCPPADFVLSELSNNANIITLACHVTYWDHLQWKDTLSHSFCTDRQRNYAKSMPLRGVYTPQIVINGTTELVGSDRVRVAEKITLKPDKISRILIDKSTDNGLLITLPALNTPNKGLVLWMFGYQNLLTQKIRSGENRGRTIAYVNAVQSLKNIGIWHGTSKVLEIQRPTPTSSGYVVLAQNQNNGIIVAAGKLSN